MNEILERDPIVKEITQILTNYESNCKNINFKRGIYIYGSPGCGKTFFIKELLSSLNYDLIKYDAGDVRNKSLIETITSNNISSQNVLQMMKKKTTKIAILMDEIDGMNNGDKGGITALIKLIRQKKTKKQKLEHMSMNPIICIGNYDVDKKIKELMKVCHIFELKTPTLFQTEKILEHKIPDFYSNLTHEFKQNILQYIQGDLRKIEFIEKISNKPGLLTEETLENIFHMKYFNADSKKITNKLLQQSIPIEEHNAIINENERTIVALLWHENIVDKLNKMPNKTAIPLYLKLLNNMCFADFIDRITFQNQIWQFNEMSSLMKTFYNNHIYHKETDLIETAKPEIRFTKVLTKYSTEYNNILFIYHLCQELDMDRKDLISFFQELRLFHGKDGLNASDTMNKIDKIFENYEIDKLDIKRIYRYLDKNVKKEALIEEDYESSDYE
jgi:DNA polymerase III delta prime subunit